MRNSTPVGRHVSRLYSNFRSPARPRESSRQRMPMGDAQATQVVARYDPPGTGYFSYTTQVRQDRSAALRPVHGEKRRIGNPSLRPRKRTAERTVQREGW